MERVTDIYKDILLSVPSAAFIMHTDINKVRALIKAGYIKALKLGELKIRREEIDRFLKDAEGKDFSDVSNVKELVI